MRRACQAGILLFAVAHCLSFWQYTVEDAYISFRYARNWAAGNGLVYNLGDRVEGYSNFAWVMVGGALTRLGFEPVNAMKRVGICLSLMTVMLLTCPGQNRRAWVHGIAALWLAGSSAFALWSGAGLETPLFVMLLSGAWFFASRGSGRRELLLSGSLFGLAALTRPETPLFVASYIAGRLLAERSRTEFKRMAIIFIVFSAWLATYLLFRIHYYGDLLPNTYYVKSVRFQGNGADYLWKSLPFTGIIPVLTMPLIFFRRIRAHSMGLLVTVFAIIAYILYQGGDWMPMARFVVPLLPAIFILGAEGLLELKTIVHRKTTLRLLPNLVTLFLVILGTIIGVRSERRNILRWESGLHEDWREVGLWLNHNTPKEAAIATGLGGIIPYFAERTNYDNGGLTNREIARVIRESSSLKEERLVVDIFIMNLEPDYYLIPNIIQLWPQPLTATTELHWDLLDHLEFRSNYQLMIIPIGGKYFAFYQRKPHLKSTR